VGVVVVWLVMDVGVVVVWLVMEVGVVVVWLVMDGTQATINNQMNDTQ
jgi:hypothetical protein